MDSWRFLPIETKFGLPKILAIDEAILNARIAKQVPNTLRLYRWNPTTASIGRNQSLNDEVDVQEAENAGVDVVRRISGGGSSAPRSGPRDHLLEPSFLSLISALNRVPDDEEDLLKLHSVGRKTANCVLVYGFNKPAIPVDTHVHRISNRLGLVDTRSPEETEAQLVKTVPRKYWLDLNDLFVRFGQTTCKPVGPRCGSCTLRSVCRYYQTVVAPKGKTS